METRHKILDVDFGLMDVTVYRGCIVSKLIGGYQILGQTCIKPEEVDEIIDNACKVVGDSINGSVTVTGGFSVSNTESIGYYKKE